MKRLEFGETPWDALSKEELLRHVQRMWSTVISLESCLKMMELYDKDSPFWGRLGSGGQALEMARQVHASIEAPHGSARAEQMYRAFFRYATTLLFDRSKYPIGFGWMVCEKDANMTARGQDDSPPTTCPDCGGPLRPLEWKDITRKKEQPNAEG